MSCLHKLGSPLSTLNSNNPRKFNNGNEGYTRKSEDFVLTGWVGGFGAFCNEEVKRR